jgi:RHS repeat-associated protein
VTTTRGANTQTVGYSYDAADRLLSACYGAVTTGATPANKTGSCSGKGTGSVTYTYDRVGNRTSQALAGTAGNATTSYRYDAADELTQLSTQDGHGNGTKQSLTYDQQGNLTRSARGTFTYNLDRTMASATVGGVTTRYGYDAERLQVSATSGSRARTWGWDVNGTVPRLAEDSLTNAGQTTTRDFLAGTQQTTLALLSGGVRSLAPDPFAGVAELLGPDGAVTDEYDYDPFGSARTNGTADATLNADNPLQYGGAYLDPTLGGQYSFPARAYDPATGRFGGVDPVPGSARNPAVSTYAYVDDRPTVLRDPSGASSNPLHDAAEAAALPQLDARYGAFNVYAGDVAPFLRGVPGIICVPTVRRRAGEPLMSCPDIIVRDGYRTLVYEVKPASRYGRAGSTARQVDRYVRSLLPPRFPGTQAGPGIVPATGPAPGGGLVQIFSGRTGRPGRRPGYRLRATRPASSTTSGCRAHSGGPCPGPSRYRPAVQPPRRLRHRRRTRPIPTWG